MQTFEYQTLVFDCPEGFFSETALNHDSFLESLNRWGAKGWELVNVFDINRYKGATGQVVAVLKRPVGEIKWSKTE